MVNLKIIQLLRLTMLVLLKIFRLLILSGIQDFDSKLSSHEHFNYVVKSCNFQLRKLSSNMKYLDIDTANIVMHALITSRIDYCNSLFVNVPKKKLGRLQSIMNRAVRLIFNLPPFSSTSSFLYTIHWLPVLARIEYKICLLVYKTLKYNSPAYLHELLTHYVPPSNMFPDYIKILPQGVERFPMQVLSCIMSFHLITTNDSEKYHLRYRVEKSLQIDEKKKKFQRLITPRLFRIKSQFFHISTQNYNTLSGQKSKFRFITLTRR